MFVVSRCGATLIRRHSWYKIVFVRRPAIRQSTCWTETFFGQPYAVRAWCLPTEGPSFAVRLPRRGFYPCAVRSQECAPSANYTVSVVELSSVSTVAWSRRRSQSVSVVIGLDILRLVWLSWVIGVFCVCTTLFVEYFMYGYSATLVRTADILCVVSVRYDGHMGVCVISLVTVRT